MSTNITLPILSEIRGRKVTRDEVLRYEDRRIAAAAKKLGVPAPTRGDVDERRKADYKDLSNLVTPIDPVFPKQIAGVARADGIAVGGVRHQSRDTADGFHARLTVEFPLPSIQRMISGHRWHLAVEFSNWIEAAIAADSN